MARIIVNAKRIQKKSRGHAVEQVGPNWFRVCDGESDGTYDVNLGVNGGTCTCAWGRHRPQADHRSGCSHVIAAMNYRALRHSRQVSVWTSDKAARRQHRPRLNIGDGLILTSRLN